MHTKPLFRKHVFKTSEKGTRVAEGRQKSHVTDTRNPGLIRKKNRESNNKTGGAGSNLFLEPGGYRVEGPLRGRLFRHRCRAKISVGLETHCAANFPQRECVKHADLPVILAYIDIVYCFC